MKSMILAMVAVFALAGSAFAGDCYHNNVAQVQAIVAQPVYVAPVRQIQFVEVPHANVQNVVVAKVQNNNHHHNNNQQALVVAQVKNQPRVQKSVQKRGLFGRQVRVDVNRG